MLTYLAIENIALVDSLTLAFDASFTALTGESGSGKSILLDCLQFVSGSPRTRTEVGAGATEGRVEAQFHLTADEARVLGARLDAHGITVDDELVLRRTLDPNGRSRCFVQGHLVPRQLLAEVASELIEFTNQGDSLSLRSPRQQLDLVDQAAGLVQTRDEFSREFAEFVERRTALEETRARLLDGEARKDFLEYQLEELGTVAFDQYETDLEILRRFDTQRERSERVEALLVELDHGDDALLRRIKTLRKRCEGLLPGDELTDAFASALDALETVEARLVAALETPELSYAEVDVRRSRVSKLEDLARKHRTPVGDLAERARRLASELAELGALSERVLALEADTTERAATLAREARALHDARAAACAGLEERVRKELSLLGLRNASLSFEVSESSLGPTGSTAIAIHYSSHPSMPARLLGKIASGGELGRVLLALRLATERRRPLLVLDEIDAGVGGKAAREIASCLRRASDFGQLLVVTHWPQVAAAAPSHIGVTKVDDGERMRSFAEHLVNGRRIEELSRMLGGASSSADEHARALLDGETTATKRERTRLREVA